MAWEDTGPKMLGNEQSETYVFMNEDLWKGLRLLATVGWLRRDMGRGWSRVVYDQTCVSIGNVFGVTERMILGFE